MTRNGRHWDARPSTPLYACSGCNRPFQRANNLEEHEQVCSEVRMRVAARSSGAPRSSYKRKRSPSPTRAHPAKRPVLAKATPSHARPAGLARPRLSETRSRLTRMLRLPGQRFGTPDYSAMDPRPSPPLTAGLDDVDDAHVYGTSFDMSLDLSIDEEHVPAYDTPFDPALDLSIDVDPPIPEGRPERARRLPARYIQDPLPEGPGPLEPVAAVSVLPRRFVQLAGRVRLFLSDTFRTLPNKFGLSRFYYGRPRTSPDERQRTLLEFLSERGSLPDFTAREPGYGLYPNWTSFSLHHWFHTYLQNSDASFSSLLKVLQSPDFDAGDTFDVPWKSIEQRLKFESRTGERLGHGWRCSPVTIQVPTADKSQSGRRQNRDGVPFTVPEFYHRSITSVMDAVFGKDPASKRFHHVPFRQFWSPFSPTWRREAVYGELYSSPAFIKAHEDLQSSASTPGCNLPRVVAAMMLGSDATHLSDFGSAQLWPIYAWWGNQSKYERCMPSAAACHCIGYLEKLPEKILQFIQEHHKGRGKKKNDPLVAHLRRELMHESLKLLFHDPDFREAYTHGRVIVGADGVARRHFPRIFTYSADYPEKVMLATIRDMGGCPCPRCLVKKADLDLLGTAADTKTRTDHVRADGPERRGWIAKARDYIYRVGLALGNDKVELLLKPQSWVPTENAFSLLFSTEDPDICKILVVDLMHEFELGVWKSLFAHLIRILHTQGQDTINELNRRYRMTSTFGSSTIRRFPTNVSDMSRMTALDFEDILQCAIPCFDRLFPDEVDTEIRQLLFIAAEWHCLAKLRMHTDSSLTLLHNATIRLGTALRHFRDTVCTQFSTTETPSEVAKRQRAVARAEAQGRTTSLAATTLRRPKAYNLNTPKLHFLGDYVGQIQWIGTTDSYSTENCERQHRTQKDRFQRTSKRDFTVQMVGQSNLHESLQETAQLHLQAASPVKRPTHDEAEIIGDQSLHYVIAEDQSQSLLYGDWLRENSCDTALEDFLPKLLHACADSLLSRDAGRGRLSLEAAQQDIFIERQRLYAHATLRVNYTTYDIRRAQDTLNVNNGKSDVLLLSADNDQPFRYARVLRVFHANVSHPILAPQPVRVDLLWVRWFQPVTPFNLGWERKELNKVRFVSALEDDAFGFVHPGQVLRACHIIPSFADGQTRELLGPSIFRPAEGDWSEFYISEFADRDLAMRHIGLGVGHVGLVPQQLVDRAAPVRLSPEPDAAPSRAGSSSGAATARATTPTVPAPSATTSQREQADAGDSSPAQRMESGAESFGEDDENSEGADDDADGGEPDVDGDGNETDIDDLSDSSDDEDEGFEGDEDDD